MGLFDFLNKKNKGIDEDKFLSSQFQNEICAFALTKLEQNNFNTEIPIRELKKLGLNKEQIDLVLEKANKFVEHSERFSLKNTELGISDDLLDSILNKEISESEIKSHFDKLFSFATFQLQNNKHGNALELFQKCLLINPDADEVYCNLSILNFDMKDFDLSLSNINKAISLNPSSTVYYHNKAQTCNHLGLQQEEKRCYEKITEIDVDDIEAIFALSRFNVRDNEFEIALQNLNKVIDLTNGSDQLFGPQLNKIGVLCELGRIEEAEDLYIKMSSLFPQEITIHHIIPNLLSYKNDTEGAKVFFDKHYETTKNPLILKAKGDFYFDKDKALAITAYSDYLTINPGDVHAIQQRALLYAETTTGYNVTADVEQILTIDPKNVNALYNKARILASQKKYEEALELTEKIYSTDKTNMNYVGFIIDVLALFKSELEVENYIIKLKANNPGEGYNIDYRKGLYYKSKELYDKAIATFSYQNEIHEFAWNYYQIALIKNLQGDTAQCIAYLRKTFQLDPSLKEDAKTYEELENLRSDSRFLEITR